MINLFYLLMIIKNRIIFQDFTIQILYESKKKVD